MLLTNGVRKYTKQRIYAFRLRGYPGKEVKERKDLRHARHQGCLVGCLYEDLNCHT